MSVTERVMRTTAGILEDQPGAVERTALLQLNLGSLGRLVQSQALQATAMHFAAIGTASRDEEPEHSGGYDQLEAEIQEAMDSGGLV